MYYLYFIFFFREREREEETGRETLISYFSHVPQSGIEHASQACALTGNRTADLLLGRTMLNPLSHAGQA